MSRLRYTGLLFLLILLSAFHFKNEGGQQLFPPDKKNDSPTLPVKLSSEESYTAGNDFALRKESTGLVPVGGLSHEVWDALLRQYVSSTGKVNYSALKKDRERLEKYLQHLADHPVQNSWSRQEKMTYWINAYNAFTVKLIIDQYPVSSIQDIHDGNPWKVEWIKLGEKNYSLDNIEHDILRPQFKDPRIHFAVNCAAASCPPLLNRAFTADNLDRQLEERAESFINNPAYNKLSPDKVRISKIFEWYRQDFGNLIEYLNRYADVQIQQNATVEFLEYDWKLNEG